MYRGHTTSNDDIQVVVAKFEKEANLQRMHNTLGMGKCMRTK